MKKTPFSTFLCLVCLLGGAVRAENADQYQKMIIEADELRSDDLNQVTVYTGRVVVTKGTILMRGSRLEIHEDPQGNQFVTLIAPPGQRAFYRQKREGVDEFFEGEGERIEYDGKADVVKFMERAEMRRYQGATMNDQLTGALMVYDNKTDVFTMTGRGAAGDRTSGGRVRHMLTPKKAASAPTADVGAPLRPSTSLGGDKK
ncbi:MAG: lipopolysaccharide transport periplasmic protein LptA [Betaproteobacteria bacterium]